MACSQKMLQINANSFKNPPKLTLMQVSRSFTYVRSV